ncbi:MAG: ammonium transporter [Alphaproteobacteria bacterium]
MPAADIAWLLTASALVLFMTLPGLALFYGGLVRAKNVLSVLMHCFMLAAVMSVAWVVLGFSLAFSGSGQWIGDLNNIFMLGTARGEDQLLALFQMTFAIITPALIIGAFVERVKFGFVILFSLLWMLICYAPVAHWVWGGGILSADSALGFFAGKGVQDLAGGVVVHTTAGVAALVLAIMIGKRPGFPKGVQPPHQPVLVMVGASMLWVGWFGFNGGSPFAANGDAVAAAFVTHISAATACVTWMLWERMRFGKASLIGIATGMVAGLASITPAAGHVGPMGALVIGGVAGILCQEMINIVKQNFSIDDSLDVFAVHGVGGIWGTLALPFLAVAGLGGAGLGDGVSVMGQFVVQIAGVVIVALFTIVTTVVITLIVRAIVGMRTDSDTELEGLDLTAHGERAYDLT